jgi:nucleotide-binding universal stress UspA family protein
MKPRSLKSILVPTDFSAGSRIAARRAMRLPLSARGRVHLVHVLPREAKRDARLQAESTRRLAREVALFKGPSRTIARSAPEVRSHFLAGDPHVELIRYAREIDADLIVLGSKGAGARMGKILGTTAARVVRMSETPVLVVRKPPRGRYRRPLIALPLDPSAHHLVELTRTVSSSGRRPISAIRAYHVPFTGFSDAGTEAEPTEYHLAFRKEAAAALSSELDSLRKRGFRVRANLRWGDPTSVVLAESRRTRADLVAVGTHARSGLAHILIGSVAESIVTSAATDVLIARPVRFTFEQP